MKYQFNRVRSDFWINVYKEDNAYSISTKSKYIKIIDHFFPILEANGPTKWRKSEKYSDVYCLWLPDGCYDQNTINKFLIWCEEAIHDVLWLGLNKNIEEYFYDELDYCIASDFNFVYDEGRTEIGEAEYQLKYNIGRISREEQEKYTGIIMNN